ncbi:MAG: hypothetical protein HZC28_02120 [Spirochaetes bacterium]|nr:hypothetical protein [Spirochaetota bacterium]
MRSIFLATLFIAASCMLTAWTKSEYQLSRVQYTSTRIIGAGGADIASADNEDVFGQNPALLTYLQTASVRDGYRRYEDEDAVFTVKKNNGRVSLSPSFSASPLSQMQSLTTVMDYSGISSSLAGIPGFETISYLLGMAGVTFNTNRPHFGAMTNIDDVTNFAAAVSDFLALNMHIDVSAPLYVPFSKNIAFLAYDHLEVMLPPGFRNDISAEIAFATQMPGMNRFSFGATVRVFNRLAVNITSEQDLLNLLSDHIVSNTNGTITTNSIIGTVMDHYMQTIGAVAGTFGGALINGVSYDAIAPLYIGNGFSADLGCVWRLSREWRLGIVLEDVYAPVHWWDGRSGYIPINMKIGASYFMPLTIAGIFENPVITFGMDDLFSRNSDYFFPTWWSFLLKTHAGLRFSVLNRFADIRLGLNQGYPSVSIHSAFDFSFLQYVPILKVIAPPEYVGPFWPFALPAYMPLVVPMNESEVRRFPNENILVFIAQWALGIVLTAHVEFSAGFYGQETGRYPGNIPVYSGFANAGAYWTF